LEYNPNLNIGKVEDQKFSSDAGRSGDEKYAGKDTHIDHAIVWNANFDVELPFYMTLALQNECTHSFTSFYYEDSNEGYYNIRGLQNAFTADLNFDFLKLINPDLEGGIQLETKLHTIHLGDMIIKIKMTKMLFKVIRKYQITLQQFFGIPLLAGWDSKLNLNMT